VILIRPRLAGFEVAGDKGETQAPFYKPEPLAICLLIHPKGGPVSVGGFRRRDADGCGRDDRAPKEISNDWGLQSAMAAVAEGFVLGMFAGAPGHGFGGGQVHFDRRKFGALMGPVAERL